MAYRKKVCTGCGRYLWLRDFYKLAKSKNHPDGYDCRCKECRRKEKNDEYARKYKVPDGIRRDKRGNLVEKNGNSVRLYWSDAKIALFKRIFPYHTNEDVAIDMECSVRTVVRRARELGLQKDQRWLQEVWNNNRRIAHAVNKICGTKADLTNFIKSGIQHRFKSGRTENPEQKAARIAKAVETRRRNSILRRSATVFYSSITQNNKTKKENKKKQTEIQ